MASPTQQSRDYNYSHPNLNKITCRLATSVRFERRRSSAVNRSAAPRREGTPWGACCGASFERRSTKLRGAA